MNVTVVQIQGALRNYRGLFKGLAKKEAPSISEGVSTVVKNADTVHISDEAKEKKLDAPRNGDPSSSVRPHKHPGTISRT